MAAFGPEHSSPVPPHTKNVSLMVWTQDIVHSSQPPSLFRKHITNNGASSESAIVNGSNHPAPSRFVCTRCLFPVFVCAYVCSLCLCVRTLLFPVFVCAYAFVCVLLTHDAKARPTFACAYERPLLDACKHTQHLRWESPTQTISWMSVQCLHKWPYRSTKLVRKTVVNLTIKSANQQYNRSINPPLHPRMQVHEVTLEAGVALKANISEKLKHVCILFSLFLLFATSSLRWGVEYAMQIALSLRCFVHCHVCMWTVRTSSTRIHCQPCGSSPRSSVSACSMIESCS